MFIGLESSESAVKNADGIGVAAALQRSIRLRHYGAQLRGRRQKHAQTHVAEEGDTLAQDKRDGREGVKCRGSGYGDLWLQRVLSELEQQRIHARDRA